MSKPQTTRRFWAAAILKMSFMLLMGASWLMYFVEVRDRQHNESVFQQCLDAAEAGRWSWNLRTGELVWDERMFKIWGKDPAHFSGQYSFFAESLHPEDLERVAGLLEVAISSQGSYRTQFRVYGDNGAVRRVRAAGGVTKDGNFMVGICLTALSPTEMPADFWAEMLKYEKQRVATSHLFE